jgi:hypothetical protein
LPCTPLAGEVALGLAVLATAWAIFWLRSRPGLMIGAAALTALLIVVAYIGGVSPTTTKIP